MNEQLILKSVVKSSILISHYVTFISREIQSTLTAVRGDDPSLRSLNGIAQCSVCWHVFACGTNVICMPFHVWVSQPA